MKGLWMYKSCVWEGCGKLVEISLLGAAESQFLFIVYPEPKSQNHVQKMPTHVDEAPCTLSTGSVDNFFMQKTLSAFSTAFRSLVVSLSNH